MQQMGEGCDRRPYQGSKEIAPTLEGRIREVERLMNVSVTNCHGVSLYPPMTTARHAPADAG